MTASTAPKTLPRFKGGLEAHVGTALLTVTTLIVSAMLYMAWDVPTKIALLEQKVGEMSAQLRDRTGDRYTRTDADRDKAVVDRQLDELRQRILRLEGKQ